MIRDHVLFSTMALKQISSLNAWPFQIWIAGPLYKLISADLQDGAFLFLGNKSSTCRGLAPNMPNHNFQINEFLTSSGCQIIYLSQTVGICNEYGSVWAHFLVKKTSQFG